MLVASCICNAKCLEGIGQHSLETDRIASLTVPANEQKERYLTFQQDPKELAHLLIRDLNQLKS